MAKCLLLLALAVGAITAEAKEKVPFTLKSKYVEQTVSKRYDATKDFKFKPNVGTDQSATLQAAIDKVSKSGGGELFIGAGSYIFTDVYMKSGVHIVVDSKAIFKPYVHEKTKNIIMLYFSTPKDDSNKYVENCSIRGEKGKFTVDYSEIPPVNQFGGKRGARFAIFRMVKNFSISNLHIIDNHSSHCGLVFLPSTCDGADKFELSRPTNGEVKNCSIDGADSGYGLCQLHGARGIYFEDIFAQGGITLRLESGAGGKYAGVFDIEAKNVGSFNARATVMLSPHCTENGRVLIDGVSSKSSSATVILHNGFIDRKHKENSDAKHGTYSSESKIYNITAECGDDAQVAKKELWMVNPVDNAYDTYRESGFNPKEVIGRSFAVVYNGTLGEYEVECKNISMKGFASVIAPIINEHDLEEQYENRWDIVYSIPVMAARKAADEAEKAEKAEKAKKTKSKKSK